MRWLSVFCILYFPFSNAASAELLTYSSGTGFFLTHDGYVLTNNHVVKNCSDITLSGPIPLIDATLVAQDKSNDLAILKADIDVHAIARLNSDKSSLRAGDPVVIVGYPGQSWQTGKAQTRTSSIIDTKGPRGDEKWLQFSDALQHGNSGGPLLNDAGNVVGVVAAKAQLVLRDTATDRDETVENFDLAISEPIMRQFLDQQHIGYEEADSGLYISPHGITDMAKKFVVNVRCKYKDQ